MCIGSFQARKAISYPIRLLCLKQDDCIFFQFVVRLARCAHDDSMLAASTITALSTGMSHHIRSSFTVIMSFCYICRLPSLNLLFQIVIRLFN